MNDKGYKVWVQIRIHFDDTSDIRYPVHLSATYWWKCELPFPPSTLMTLRSVGDCPIQEHRIEGPVTYDVNDAVFICHTTSHYCKTQDEFDLKSSLLTEVCKKKPF